MNQKLEMQTWPVLFLFVPLFIFISVICAYAGDIEFGVQPRAGAGILRHTLNFHPSENLLNTEYIFSDTIPYMTFGSTFFLNSFYLDLQWQQSVEGYDQYGNSAHIDDPNVFIDMDGNVEFDYQDSSVAFGYGFKNNLSVFAGYKYSSIHAKLKGYAVFNTFDDGSMTGITGFPISFRQNGDIGFKYDTKGPFIGVSYGFLIKDKGAISLRLAVASLVGELIQSGGYHPVDTGPSLDLGRTFNIETKGDAIGLSYNFGWKSMLTDRLGYSMSMGGYKYNFDNANAQQPNMTETLYYVSVNLFYSFIY